MCVYRQKPAFLGVWTKQTRFCGIRGGVKIFTLFLYCLHFTSYPNMVHFASEVKLTLFSIFFFGGNHRYLDCLLVLIFPPVQNGCVNKGPYNAPAFPLFYFNLFRRSCSRGRSSWSSLRRRRASSIPVTATSSSAGTDNTLLDWYIWRSMIHLS